MDINMDRAASYIVDLVVRLSRRYPFEVWKKGEKLKILMVGYNGKRNTGADVRVVPMVEQFMRILGKDNVDIGILSINIEQSEIYYRESPTAKLLKVNTIYFMDLLKACSSHHMAVLSEGSCLKSKFANALTLFFSEAAGVMKEQGKPCIAYGSEAGYMEPFLYKISERLFKGTYFIARTSPSLDIIRKMGLEGKIGTDTAWTFPPVKKEWAIREIKKRTGWDGIKPLVGVAVVNPFFYPVRPSLIKFFSLPLRKELKDYHYEKYYFYYSSKDVEEKFENYINSIASAMDDFVKRHDAHPVIIGMDMNDIVGVKANACLAFQKALKTEAHIFDSLTYDGYQMTAILRWLSMLVTSRYHARVLSMPGGIPSIAVSIDERLHNLLEESGHKEDYLIEADDIELKDKLIIAMEKMWGNREKVSEEILKTIPGYLRLMADMGVTFRDFIEKKFPQFPLPPKPKSWQGYLPTLYPELRKIVKDYKG